MQRKLLALSIPPDTHHDAIDRVIGEAFGTSCTSFSPDGQTYHFHDLVRDGDTVRSVETGVEMTVRDMAALLRDHCGFIRPSAFQVDENTNALARIEDQE